MIMGQDQDTGAGRDPPPVEIDDAADIPDELLDQEAWLKNCWHGQTVNITFDEL
jgi:hypothetical protein